MLVDGLRCSANSFCSTAGVVNVREVAVFVLSTTVKRHVLIFERVTHLHDKGGQKLHVKVYNFSTPIKIQISFSQSPPINWVLFFVIFAACFVVLLVVAGLLWMIKLRIEVFRRNQRRYDEIEQMASRPFASVRLELTSPQANLVSVT
ncbi:unnamed protein product [Gongylonema pulchrum]|uniref:Integrin_alpha2 domain-containing protein n=1 Tax=Gongylonema pulchrum TaxID=637853 RepID=A0A183EVH1_9BILA|nr:unnamed protein product [Gongylonema pulchrum]